MLCLVIQMTKHIFLRLFGLHPVSEHFRALKVKWLSDHVNERLTDPTQGDWQGAAG